MTRTKGIVVSVLLAASAVMLSAQPAANPADALLDVLVWGIHMSIDPAAYPQALRTEVELHLRRAKAYVSKRAVPPFPEGKMISPRRSITNVDWLRSRTTPVRCSWQWRTSTACGRAMSGRVFTIVRNVRPNSPTNTWQPTRTDRSARTCLCSRHIAGCAPRKRTTTSKRLRMRNAAGASTSRDSRPPRNRESC